MRLTAHQHNEMINYLPIVCYLPEPSLQSKCNIICRVLIIIHFRHIQNYFKWAA